MITLSSLQFVSKLVFFIIMLSDSPRLHIVLLVVLVKFYTMHHDRKKLAKF